MNVHSSLFIAALNLKQAKYPSVGKWINNFFVYLYYGILLSKYKERTIVISSNMDESQKHYGV